MIISKRDITLTRREPFGFLLYLMQVFFIGAFGWLTYSHTSRDYVLPSGFPNEKAIFDRMGSFTFILMNTYLTLILNSSFRMANENLVLYKEISDKQYSALIYLITKIFLDVLFIHLAILLIVYPVIFFIIFEDNDLL